MRTKQTYIVIFLLNLLYFNGLSAVIDDDSRVSIPFEVINGLIIIQAEVDAQVGNYIFDTGAEELIINEKVLDANTTFTTINGDISTRELSINLLKVGTLTHKKVKAYGADLNSMESYLKMSLQGVIGCNLFMPRKIKIDFVRNEIIMTTKDDLTSDREHYVTFEMYDGVPVCPLMIGGDEYLFGFDTGATMHVIDADLTAELDGHLRDTGLDTFVSSGTGDKTIHKILSLDDMSLGSHDMNDIHFLVQDLSEFNQSMESEISGVLSLTALQTTDIVIDLQQKRIYF